jgi:hypothetical protein
MDSTARLFFDDRGTALLETLIALPLLLVTLVGIAAVNSNYGAKLEAKARGRRMAWLQADSGKCPARGCKGGGCEAIEADLRAGALDPLSTAQAAGYSLRSFVDNLRDFLVGRTTTGIGTASAAIPRSLMSDQPWQRGATTLVCNTTQRQTDSGESVLDHACSTDLNTTEYASEVCR